MRRNKKIKRSSFKIGQKVIVTNDYRRFIKGQVVVVLNNEKKGSEYTNEVKNEYGIAGPVPKRYLKAIKNEA